MAKSTMDKFDINPEYLNQKLRWEEKIADNQHVFSQEINSLTE